MSKGTRLLLLAGGGFLLWKYLKKDQGSTGKLVPVQPLPQGAVLTGEVVRTTNAGPPGSEVVGYGVRDWAKYKVPSGHEDWAEVRRAP